MREMLSKKFGKQGWVKGTFSVYDVLVGKKLLFDEFKSMKKMF